VKQWQDVIRRSSSKTIFNIYQLDDKKITPTSSVKTVVVRHSLKDKQYYLGENYPAVYFTRREAECLYYLLRGFTISATALQLNLSARTVEFYVKNMKQKMGVKNKSELMERLHAVGFMQVINAQWDQRPKAG
jgi:DNA-binding CsgD family transcriptional regulator